MTAEQISNLIRTIPERGIYELLDLENIQIVEDVRMARRKCDSTILAAEGLIGIFLKPDLTEEYRQFLLWHEFGHYKLHYDKNMCFNFYLSRYNWKTEQEANLFAAMGLLKDEMLEDQNIISLLTHKGMPEPIAVKLVEFLI